MSALWSTGCARFFRAVAMLGSLALLASAYAFGQAGTCAASKLVFQFTTGADDLRGGNNNLNVEVHFADHSLQVVKNLNQGLTWGGKSFNTVNVPLQHPIHPAQITQLVLIHDAQAGVHFNGPAPPFPVLPLSEDNWDMAQLTVVASGPGVDSVIATAGPHRFTGSDPSFGIDTNLPVSCQSGTITQLRLTFATGNDDLRGGNDNLNVIVHYNDGGPDQVESNVNHSSGWSNGSQHSSNIFLNRASAVQSITLQTTFTGGTNGDNWNMDSLQVVGLGVGVHQPLATAGFHRFTGPPGTLLTIPITGWPAPPPPTVSGGPSQCSPTDMSAYCRTARMSRAQGKVSRGPLLSGGTSQGLSSQAPQQSSAGSASSGVGSLRSSTMQPMLQSQPQAMLSNQLSTQSATVTPRGGLLSANGSQAGSQKTLTNADVITMVKSGKAEPDIVGSISASQHRFDFSSAGCRSLLQAGVSANVLKAMGDGSVVPCGVPGASSSTRGSAIRR